MRGKPVRVLKSRSVVSFVLLGIIFLALPFFLPPYWVNLFSECLIISIFAVSINLLQGYMGLASLGQAAYFGVSAYTVAFLTTGGISKTGYLFVTGGISNFLFVLAAGILLAGIVSAIFGLLALRASGMVFLMLTLALAQLLYGLAVSWSSFTDSTDGLPGIPRPELRLPWSMWDATNFLLFCFVL